MKRGAGTDCSGGLRNASEVAEPRGTRSGVLAAVLVAKLELQVDESPELSKAGAGCGIRNAGQKRQSSSKLHPKRGKTAECDVLWMDEV